MTRPRALAPPARQCPTERISGSPPRPPATALQTNRPSDYLFSTTLANRLEATTEVDNVVEQRALEHAGFVREGVLRGRGFVRGEWRDGVMYARLRDDPAPQVGIE